MAVKFFGKCTGNSGGKYDIWLEVNENSHNVKNNTSNLTVKLKLKRNDGYTNSAYNLNKSDNFAKITINNSVKSSGNLSIDTRNNVVVTLCSWSGDILHDTTGKLSVTVGGNFTINGTSISGGSVSGVFNCLTIPRITPFTLNKSDVNCGESVSLTLTPYSDDFNHIVNYSLNDVELSVSIPKGTTQVDLNVPVEWANKLTNSNQGVIYFELKTYIGTSLIGSTTQNIKMIIPPTEEFLPEYSFHISYNKNNVVPYIWDAVIQNKSTLTISINSFEGRYGASFSSCYIIVGDTKKYGESAEFELPVAGRIKVKVHVTDTRGFYKEEETLIDVDAYSSPYFICNNIFRCNSDGTPDENGTSVLIDFTKKYSSVRGLNMSYVKVKYKKSNQTEYSSLIQLNSSPFILNGDFEKENSYEFVFQITDVLTKTPIEAIRTLPSGSIPFNIKKGGKGAAFGCYAETDNELTIGYNLNLKGLFKYESLNNSINTNTTQITFLNKDLRRYEALRIISIDFKVQFLENVAANTYVEIFQFKNITFQHTYSLPFHIDGRISNNEGNTVSCMNPSGVVKIVNSNGFFKGNTLNINAIITY